MAESGHRKKTFSEILDAEEKLKAVQKFILVNDTPHYPISFTTEEHLRMIAKQDVDIDHPLGAVFMNDRTHPDNDLRIVMLKSDKVKSSVEALYFSKNKWNDKKNPFSEINKEIQRYSFSETMRSVYWKIRNIRKKMDAVVW